MDLSLDTISDLFNFALAVTFACLLWNLVHPEHFDWLRVGYRKIFPVNPNPKPVNEKLERNLVTIFVGVMILAAVFGLMNLLTYGKY